MFEKTIKLLDSFIEMGVPGFDCIVLKDGEPIFRRTKGFSNLEAKVQMNGKERYNIYSCSKLITCIAALQLYEKGLLGLDDKLSDYIPEFENMQVTCDNGTQKARNPILIRHLFNMTGGFSYNTNTVTITAAQNETNGRCDTGETVKYLAKNPLCFEPGEAWRYSFCHDVLAAVVEVVSGERFGLYVKKNIFDPLGMKNSTFLLPTEELETICEQYIFDANTKTAKNCGKNIMYYKFGQMYESGGAGAISTLDDYIKLLEAVRKGDSIIKRETVDLMLCDCMTDKLREFYWYPDYGYGLGVRTPMTDMGTTDFGWGGAAGAYWAVDRENGITMYYAQHMLNSPNKQERYILYATVKEDLFGKEKSSDFELDSKLSQFV